MLEAAPVRCLSGSWITIRSWLVCFLAFLYHSSWGSCSPGCTSLVWRTPSKSMATTRMVCWAPEETSARASWPSGANACRSWTEASANYNLPLDPLRGSSWLPRSDSLPKGMLGHVEGKMTSWSFVYHLFSCTVSLCVNLSREANQQLPMECSYPMKWLRETFFLFLILLKCQRALFLAYFMFCVYFGWE